MLDKPPLSIAEPKYDQCVMRSSGDVISSEDKKADFLAKAKEAEAQAEKATDETAKASWLRIAAGYHDLAAHEEQH